MTIKELLTKEIDVDVYNDVLDTVFCAFCGPQKLTQEGKKYFADVLNLEIDYKDGDCAATILLDDADEKVWKARYKKCKELFCWMAGYVDEEIWNKMFIMED